jgi:hypothetical protein
MKMLLTHHSLLSIIIARGLTLTFKTVSDNDRTTNTADAAETILFISPHLPDF